MSGTSRGSMESLMRLARRSSAARGSGILRTFRVASSTADQELTSRGVRERDKRAQGGRRRRQIPLELQRLSLGASEEIVGILTRKFTLKHDVRKPLQSTVERLQSEWAQPLGARF